MLYIYKYPKDRQKFFLRRFATCVLANVDLYGKLVWSSVRLIFDESIKVTSPTFFAAGFNLKFQI